MKWNNYQQQQNYAFPFYESKKKLVQEIRSDQLMRLEG